MDISLENLFVDIWANNIGLILSTLFAPYFVNIF